MKKKLLDWHFSFLIIPLISFGLVYGLYKTIYPVMTYDIFPFQISSLIAIKLIAASCSYLIPIIVSKLYAVRLLTPTILWTSCTILALVMDKGIYDGNPNSALLLDILPYQLLATTLTVGFIVKVKKKNNCPRMN